MADVFTKQVIENGSRNYVAQYTCLWTLTAQITGYVAADPTATGDMGVSLGGNTLYPGTHLKLIRASYDMTDGLSLQIQWDATSPQNAMIFNGSGSGKQMYRPQGGIPVPQSAGAPIAGATGKLIFNTTGSPRLAGDFCSITLWLRKDINQ